MRSPRRSRAYRDHRAYREAARRRLRSFRRASALAVALTGVLLIALSGVQGAGAQETRPEEAAREAAGALREMVLQFYELLPKVLIAAAVLLVAWLLARLIRPLLRAALGSWPRARAIGALASVALWLLAFATAFAVVAGDPRAMVGSIGLFGLALSWALQTPIESFTGWLLNSFRGYYRVGDRIAVGDVRGDVTRIDLLATTVWQAGSAGGGATGRQTGALVTFPNLEILRSNIVNFTLDFPYVWHETVVAVANESDLRAALRLVGEVAGRVVGEAMAEPARAYRALLERAGLGAGVSAEPEVYVSLAESWTNLTVRYVVPARQRARWESQLLVALAEELQKPENRERIHPAYPRRQVELRERSE